MILSFCTGLVLQILQQNKFSRLVKIYNYKLEEEKSEQSEQIGNNDDVTVKHTKKQIVMKRVGDLGFVDSLFGIPDFQGVRKSLMIDLCDIKTVDN